MNKKGFTLLELLAVIVVLAIIALIATPFVTEAINEAKKGAALNSAYGLVQAAETYYVSRLISDPYDGNIVIAYEDGKATVTPSSPVEFKYTGKVPNKGSVVISKNGTVLLDEITFDDFSFDGGNKTTLVATSTREKPNFIDTLISTYNNTTDNGLIKDGNFYYYRGNPTDNYLWYGGFYWRIVSADKDSNTIKLVSDKALTGLNWSNGDCMTSVENNCGSLATSNVGSWLGESESGVFLNAIKGTDLYNHLQEFSYDNYIYDSTCTNDTCVQLPNNTTYLKHNNTSTKVSLLTYNEINRAKSSNFYIKNGMYLADTYGKNQWDGDAVYYYDWGETIGNYWMNSALMVYPTITISDIILVSDQAKGTINDPYRVKSDETALVVSSVKTGEYIKVPCEGEACGGQTDYLVRVVSKDDNTAKVVLNSIYATSTFDDNNIVFASDSTITSKLNEFLNNIPSNIAYKNITSPKRFNIKGHIYGSSYTTVKDATDAFYNGNVGLPVFGEIFSGNDIGNEYWLMGNSSNDSLYYTSNYGYLNRAHDFTSTSGVRPVFFIYSNLEIESGIGTMTDPYVLKTI